MPRLQSFNQQLRRILAIEYFQFTPYFENSVLRKKGYLRKEWCVYVVENAEASKTQENNRVRFWAKVPDFGNRYLRVVTLEDRCKIHGAFPDRRFKS